VDLPTGYRITEERIEELLSESLDVSESDMILRVKKPDYLGKSSAVSIK